MEFRCQRAALDELSTLSKSDRHSILIEGPTGCGKSWLAHKYAEFVDVADVVVVKAAVADIKEATEKSYQLDTRVLMCIENLDKGVAAASYAILKLLEEPRSNIYIAVTCNNSIRVPDTIVSRSACVSVAAPTNEDLIIYGQHRDATKLSMYQNTALWRCVKTFSDVDQLFGLSPTQVEYFNSLPAVLRFTDSVSDMMWKLGHYSDNTVTPVNLVLRYMMISTDNPHNKKAIIDCMNTIETGRVAAHTALARMLFECKYCE